MSLEWTLALTVAFAGLAGLSAWRGARPIDIHRGPRMAPWRFLMLVSVVAVLFLVVHLLNLAGVPTGPEMVGRR